MTTRTRYFVITSLLVLFVGLGTGLVAYYVGFPAGAFARRGGPDELQYIPRDAAIVAYANVHEVMTSDLRRRVKEAVPVPEDGQRKFQEETGINIETDIDHVVACVDPGATGDNGTGLVIAQGRFDQFKIEALVRQREGRIEEYKGKKLMMADPGRGDRFALAFIHPDLIAIGSTTLVRAAIDRQNGGDSVASNEELMNLVRSLDNGNAWAVGRFDALRAKANLPAGVASQIPAITWFSVSSHIDGGIRGVVRAETRDEESANNLRDVVRGFLALAKMQAGSRPELQTLVQSLELGGTGKTVALSFAVPPQVLDLLGKAAAQKHEGR